MEPQPDGHEFPGEARAHRAAALRQIPLDHDDEESLNAAPPSETDAVDAWANVEPPADDIQEEPQPKPEAGLDCGAGFQPAEHRAESLHRNHALASIPAPSEPEEDESPEKGGWIVSLLGAGISIVAVCLLLPLAEENHQLAWQREKLKTDLLQIEQQVRLNDEFLKNINDDPTLSERLAQRQMKFIRKGTTILDLPDNGKEEMSPFQLVTLPPPNPIPPYRPLGGVLSAVVRNPHLRLYLAGCGLLLLAAGLVLGGEAKKVDEPQ